MKNRDDVIRAGLRSEISEVESALSNSYENLQLINEEGMIDFYSYMIKAYEAKHRHLMRKLKEI